MDTRLPLFYLFIPIMQIAHPHPSLWQQQPWHAWQSEAKDFLRLSMRVPMVNPRWMHIVWCVHLPQPWQALCSDSGSRGAQPLTGCAQGLVGCGVGSTGGSACGAVPGIQAHIHWVLACGLLWLNGTLIQAALESQAGSVTPESVMSSCVNAEQVSKRVCGTHALIHRFQLSLLIYGSWQHLFNLIQLFLLTPCQYRRLHFQKNKPFQIQLKGV